jgi:hypothetical protein
MHLRSRRQQAPSRYFAGRPMVATEVMRARSKAWTLHGQEIAPKQQTCGANCSKTHISAAAAVELCPCDRDVLCACHVERCVSYDIEAINS